MKKKIYIYIVQSVCNRPFSKTYPAFSPISDQGEGMLCAAPCQASAAAAMKILATTPLAQVTRSIVGVREWLCPF